jgi:nucleoid DNA-binding protein
MAKAMSKKNGSSKKSNGGKSAAASKPGKITAAGKQRTKGEIYRTIAEQTGLGRKDVASVFDTMSRMMAADLAKPSRDKAKVFVVPGLMKVTAQYKPPTPERQGKNPFTGEMQTFKAKPASTKIRIRPLKQLKAMV